nr:hypothetical protein [Tanacetum cinerariifolium]
CRKTTNNNAQGRAHMLKDRNAHQNLNVVTVGQIVPAFLKEPICKVYELLVSLLELNRFEILLGELEISQVPFGLRHLPQHLPFKDGNESYNRNLLAILANDVVSCSTLSDQGCAKDFYDQ